MKHTKGTWIENDGQIYPQETGKTLALIPYFDNEDEEQKANAKLIAAAPDMLAALQELVGVYHEQVETVTQDMLDKIHKAEEAIQKATSN